MRVILSEGSRPNEIGYHFTNIEGLQAILKDNIMLATNDPLDEGITITRYNLTFPDGSELNVDDPDGFYLQQWLDELTDYWLDRIENSLLREKIKQFKIESKDDIKIEEYEYTPYKDLIGKKSWSYTRKPEGMSYRNFKTFEENTVRIGIDIHKLTEKGYKVVPFSWINQPKSGSHNEFEERVFGEGKREKGTSNFMDFVTEIAFPYMFSEQEEVKLCLNKLKALIELKEAANSARDILIHNFTPRQLLRSEYFSLGTNANILIHKIKEVKKLDLKSEKDLYQIIDEKKPSAEQAKLRDTIKQINPNINIIIANPDTGKEINDKFKNSKTFKKYLNTQVEEFISDIEFFQEYHSERDKLYNKIVLTDPGCKHELRGIWNIYKSELENIPYYEKVCNKCEEKYEKYSKLIKESEINLEHNIKEIEKILDLIIKESKHIELTTISDKYSIILVKDKKNMFDSRPFRSPRINLDDSSSLTMVLFRCIYDIFKFDEKPDSDTIHKHVSINLLDCPQNSSASFMIYTKQKEYKVTAEFKKCKFTISIK